MREQIGFPIVQHTLERFDFVKLVYCMGWFVRPWGACGGELVNKLFKEEDGDGKEDGGGDEI